MGFVMSEMGFPKIVVPAAISCSVCCSAVGFVYQVCLAFWRCTYMVYAVHYNIHRMYDILFLGNMQPLILLLYQFCQLCAQTTKSRVL
jgi:hypothetical protein